MPTVRANRLGGGSVSGVRLVHGFRMSHGDVTLRLPAERMSGMELFDG